MAPSSPNVSAPSSGSTLLGRQTSSAPPRTPPDWRNTATGHVQIHAGGEPQPADDRVAKVGKDVAVQVVGHDDLEALRLAYQLHRQGVHVAVLGFDATELGGDALEGLLPDLVSGHRVRFVAHGDANLAVILRPPERGADDPLNALGGVDLFGDVLIAVDAPPAEIHSFGV